MKNAIAISYAVGVFLSFIVAFGYFGAQERRKPVGLGICGRVFVSLIFSAVWLPIVLLLFFARLYWIGERAIKAKDASDKLLAALKGANEQMEKLKAAASKHGSRAA